MALGGIRPGAGRPKGSKVARTKELIAEAVKGGMTPLEYMLKVMRDEDADVERRDLMAEKAAQYVHPKLTAMDISGPEGGPIPMSLEVTFVNSPNAKA